MHAAATRNPAEVVPGLQVDGYFPDTSTTNAYRGWLHDSQFVLRLPNDWNGKLVVTGAPGVRRQFAPDFIIGDFVLAKGYAYASTDKGNSGTSFYEDGARPGDAVAEWHRRVTELTRAAKQAVRSRYGRLPARTYMTGISNGGYLTRWQLENHPELYDGGVDWEGTLMRADGPNLFTYLPTALREYAAYKRGDAAAHQRFFDVGFAPGSEQQWDDHYTEYWDLTQRSYREEFDPGYDGALEGGTPFCQSGDARVRRRLRLRGAPAGGQGRRRPRLADRAHRQAAADAARHARRAAADPHGLRRLRAHDPRRRPRRAAPLLRDRGRQPRRLPLRPLPGRAAADPALLPRRLHGLRGDDRARRGAAAEPDRRAHRGRRRRQPLPARRRRRDGRGRRGGAARPRMRIRVAPRRVRAGRRTRIRFRVTSRGRPVRGARCASPGARSGPAAAAAPSWSAASPARARAAPSRASAGSGPRASASACCRR